MDQTSEANAADKEDTDTAPTTGDKSPASPRLKQVRLLRPESVDMCASVASLDIQLATPMCHLSTPKRNNPLFQRAFSDSGERLRKVLHKALSTEMMVTVEENGEDLQKYPLKKRRTSVSMQHIPSSSLLKDLGDTSLHGEKIEETEGKENESQCKTVPSNTESYVENTTGIDESQTETTAMLKVKDDATSERKSASPSDATVPQVSIVISDAEDKQQGKNDNDAEVKETTKKSGCLKKMQNLIIVKLFR